MLTNNDLHAISKLLDEKLDEKLKPINEFVDYAKPILDALLEESQNTFSLHLPERVKRLETIHPGGQHPS